MPLSEFLAKSTMNNSSNPFYLSDNEFSELIWENGQIVAKTFPDRVQERATHTNISSTGTGAGFLNNKGKNADLTAFPGNDFVGAQDEEDMVPWIHYPLDQPLQPDPIQPDFCSDFLEDFAGANPSTLGLTSTQATTTATGSGTGLSKRETDTVNFSLFKGRVARPASSPVCAPDRPLVRASEKESCSKRLETVLPSASVCSDNSEGFENTEPKHAGKRKIREGDTSSSNSEEMEDESVGGKRFATGRGASAKKSRAAEVHNLSERRRRERINEKMKALQELIPNCSKADKASMLDDAIEYLKSLQLQVQMMSMGSGMYMPPPVMMMSTMQLMRAPPMPHFSPMGVGLYQMGMYPPIPQLHPHQFIPGPPAMHGAVAQTPFHPSVPVPAPVDPRPTLVGSSCEDAGSGASMSSAFVRERRSDQSRSESRDVVAKCMQKSFFEEPKDKLVEYGNWYQPPTGANFLI